MCCSSKPENRLSFRVVKDPRFERLTCLHKGTYADDCLVQRVTQVRDAYESVLVSAHRNQTHFLAQMLYCGDLRQRFTKKDTQNPRSTNHVHKEPAMYH